MSADVLAWAAGSVTRQRTRYTVDFFFCRVLMNESAAQRRRRRSRQLTEKPSEAPVTQQLGLPRRR